MANKRKARRRKDKRPSTRLRDHQPWTRREIDFVKEGFTHENAATISKALRRSITSVRNKAAELEACKGKRWTSWETEFIRKHYQAMALTDLAQTLCRPVDAVKHMAQSLARQGKLKLKRPPARPWTAKELHYLKKHTDTPQYVISKKLNRTSGAIQQKKTKLGLPSRKSFWTPTEDRYLRDNHRQMTRQALADHLGRTKGAVANRLDRLGLRKTASIKRWTASEDAFLRKAMGVDPSVRMTREAMSRDLGRTPKAVESRLQKLGLSESIKDLHWQHREINYLRKNYQKKTYQEMGEHLGRSASGVEYQMARLGLHKQRRTGTQVPWQPREIAYIKNNYAKKTARELATHLKRSRGAVNTKIRLLGLCNKQPIQKRVPWRPREVAYLKKNYRKQSTREMASHLKRSFSSVKGKLHDLGLFKSNA